MFRGRVPPLEYTCLRKGCVSSFFFLFQNFFLRSKSFLSVSILLFSFQTPFRFERVLCVSSVCFSFKVSSFHFGCALFIPNLFFPFRFLDSLLSFQVFFCFKCLLFVSSVFSWLQMFFISNLVFALQLLSLHFKSLNCRFRSSDSFLVKALNMSSCRFKTLLFVSIFFLLRLSSFSVKPSLSRCCEAARIGRRLLVSVLTLRRCEGRLA